MNDEILPLPGQVPQLLLQKLLLLGGGGTECRGINSRAGGKTYGQGMAPPMVLPQNQLILGDFSGISRGFSGTLGDSRLLVGMFRYRGAGMA